ETTTALVAVTVTLQTLSADVTLNSVRRCRRLQAPTSFCISSTASFAKAVPTGRTFQFHGTKGSARLSAPSSPLDHGIELSPVVRSTHAGIIQHHPFGLRPSETRPSPPTSGLTMTWCSSVVRACPSPALTERLALPVDAYSPRPRKYSDLAFIRSGDSHPRHSPTSVVESGSASRNRIG
ncbi:hypothetical protein AWZ03_015095, partial [Drosophila navojoa]